MYTNMKEREGYIQKMMWENGKVKKNFKALSK